MLERSVRQLNLESVIEGCQAESGQSRTEETGYCFELFRRALEDQEQGAWAAIDQQYKRLILHWISDNSPTLSRTEIEEIAPETLPKFWHSLNRSTVPLTDRFAHVGAVLKYLKQCAISVLRDYERRLRRMEQVTEHLEGAHQTQWDGIESEQELLGRIEREQLLSLVRKWVQTYVVNAHERQVLSLSYEYGLTPAQIANEYPQDFPDAQTVRRIKERILKRARRAFAEISSQPLTTNGRNGVQPIRSSRKYEVADG